MKRRNSLLLAFAVLGTLLGQDRAFAQVTHVVDNIGDCNGASPCYATITDAVNAAAEYDSIEVFPSVYRERVDISRRPNVVVKARSKARPPVIAGDLLTFSGGVQVLNLIIEGQVFVGPQNGNVIEGNLVKGSISALFGNGCTVSNNTVLNGSLSLGTANSCLIEGNTVVGGSITIGGDDPTAGNVIRRNLVRGGGIRLFDVRGKLRNNVVEGNFVSGSLGDGIRVDGIGGFTGVNNLLRNNTSIENAGCDINDTSRGEPTQNIWRNNRFGTKCGGAID